MSLENPGGDEAVGGSDAHCLPGSCAGTRAGLGPQVQCGGCLSPMGSDGPPAQARSHPRGERMSPPLLTPEPHGLAWTWTKAHPELRAGPREQHRDRGPLLGCQRGRRPHGSPPRAPSRVYTGPRFRGRGFTSAPPTDPQEHGSARTLLCPRPEPGTALPLHPSGLTVVLHIRCGLPSREMGHGGPCKPQQGSRWVILLSAQLGCGSQVRGRCFCEGVSG